MPDFVHLHCHTQFSLLDGASEIGAMMRKAKADGQKGVALTDHGNMFGAFKFVAEAEQNGLKPIVGCEFYLVDDRHQKTFTKELRDRRYHQLLLAKNRQGYENISKLCSLGYTEGLYSKYPRIDKEALVRHHEGLIATSCCIGAEIPQAILHGQLEKAETLLRWWVDLFGEDFYIELQRHRGLENIDGSGVSQEDINQVLLGFAQKYGLKVIATNDSHYLEEADASPHDVLLSVNTGSLLEDEKRFRFPSSDFYFKTQSEMAALFHDVPQALDNTIEIFDKIETLSLRRDILLPAFPLPEGFKSQDDYLRHLTYEGARRRYGHITPAIQERLDFELSVIAKSGYPGYFLIVQDFTTAARRMGVSVGPGRGSAAGSAVAYCVGITNVDPIKYDLLFERFLNPERVSMPDIDIDFDDEGRQRVIDYVIDKYGRDQVAQIVTYGTMAAKSAIKDVGRVMNIPLNEVNNVTKIFPANPKASLGKLLKADGIDPKLKESLTSDDLDRARQIRDLAEREDNIGEMIRMAKQLEGSVRNTGIHACGVVITPDEITKYVPVKVDKEGDMLSTQFDNSVAEEAGLLKMDFLGLRTLTIIKDAVRLVKARHGIDLDMDAVPLDDPDTYKLFQRGETVGIFQYESEGMQKHMKDLVPTTFEDLIAMNALYRPGPLEYIPNFIARKHGREPIVYDLPATEEYLKDTYGITVYQEQVMLLSQKLANFSKGQADVLRKAMGKKKKADLDKLYPLFIENGTANGHPRETLDKIWRDWEAFASYAFNKSHSTCYAFVAFQTAYLKAHYPAEFMASVLTHNKSDIKKITFFLQECQRMGLDVLPPDINESLADFSVNKKGQIRFGLTALKGVGEGPVDEILDGRGKGGPFRNIFDLVRRLEMRALNKKALESLVLGGAFDSFAPTHRAQYFAPSDKYDSLLEHAIRYGSTYRSQKQSTAMSLFGETNEVMIPEPAIPDAEPWSIIEKLEKEKEVTGLYVSGHPLDGYRMEVEHFSTCSLDALEQKQGQAVRIACLVTKAEDRTSKKGSGYGRYEVQDFSGSHEFTLFRDDYAKHRHLLQVGTPVFIVGSYQPGWGDDQRYELKIQDLRHLDSVSEQMTRSILLKVPLHQVNAAFVEDFGSLCASHAGRHDLKLLVFDPQQGIGLRLIAAKQKVNADSGFISAVEKMGLEYQLNA